MGRLRVSAVLVIFALYACGGPFSRTLLPEAFVPSARSASVRLVGYWDGWSRNNLVRTPAGVTEIPIAFGFLRGHTIVMTNGNLTRGYVTAADIRALHARGVAVTLSLGGWSPKTSFKFDGDVAGYEASLATVLATLPFDGVDFDLEHGSAAGRVKTLSTLIVATRAYFNSIGKPDAVITYPAWNRPTDYGDNEILTNPKVAAALSWVNVMSYEKADVAKAESDVAAYGAIFDKSRLNLGVDIDDNPHASIAQLGALSQWVRANGYGGVMVWTVNSMTRQQMKALRGS
ncbi:MAG TPA: glycoside hydrolase family 18 protein [Candidatus Baltobacteraceae bacterium]